MAFRTIIIDSHSKLEYSLNYLIFRTPDNVKRILLDEIQTLIVQSTAVAITTSLLCELVKRKIKVIFCDEKCNPISELSPLYGSHNTSGRLLEQIDWSEDNKNNIWRAIVKQKIINQAKSLKRKGLIEEYNMLLEYEKDVMPGDITNREGHSAKVYFNSVYFKGFSRDKECAINNYLNYGYTILLAEFNRSIVSFGYSTQLGIHHKNEFNQFNLSCDLMEPFRYIVDDYVESIKENDDWKDKMIELLSKEVLIDGKNQNLVNAIQIYCQSVFNALKNNDASKIKFIENDL